jgi:hypothetical protein
MLMIFVYNGGLEKSYEGIYMLVKEIDKENKRRMRLTGRWKKGN